VIEKQSRSGIENYAFDAINALIQDGSKTVCKPILKPLIEAAFKLFEED